jgi:hypothetical protein
VQSLAARVHRKNAEGNTQEREKQTNVSLSLAQMREQSERAYMCVVRAEQEQREREMLLIQDAPQIALTTRSPLYDKRTQHFEINFYA